MTPEELAELEALENEAMEEVEETPSEPEEIVESEPEESESTPNEESAEEPESTPIEPEEVLSEESEEPSTPEFGSQSFEVEVNGHKVKLDSLEDLKKLAQEGANAKLQKPAQKTDLELMAEQHDISTDDLALLIKAKQGDASAISALAKKAGVDSMDIDESKADAFKNDIQVSRPSEVDIVAHEILSKPVLAQKFRDISSSLPQDFIAKVSSDAQTLKDFSRHVESGLAAEIAPLAYKASLNGEDFFTAYAREGRQLVESRKTGMDNSGNSRPSEKRQANKEVAKELQKHLAPSGNNKGKSSAKTADDIWNMSEEDFLKVTI